MVYRLLFIEHPETSLHLDNAAVLEMAFDLNDATVDLTAIECCALELLRRRYPTGAVARLLDRAINEARQQRSNWP